MKIKKTHAKWGIAGIIVVIIALFFVFRAFKPAEDPGTEPGKYDEFAKCLTENSVKMYGTAWCSHCNNQKAMFGNSFQYVDFVDCDLMSAECDEAGVTGYPTWGREESRLVGEQSFEALAEFGSCELV